MRVFAKWFSFHKSMKYVCKVTALTVFLFSYSALKSQTQDQGRVVLISLDGTPDYLIDKFLKNGVLPSNGAFARIRKTGAYANTVYPVNVASTGPSHISIFTGVNPGTTGIVGNSFKSRKQNWTDPVLTAFRQPFSAETLFRTAMRQGKKVITLAGVGIDYSDSSRMTDNMLMYPVISGTSALLNLVDSKEKILWKNSQYSKLIVDSNSTKASIQLGGGQKKELWLYLKDTAVNDANIIKPSFKIIFDTDSLLSNGYLSSLEQTGWTVLPIHEFGKVFTVSTTLFQSSLREGSFQLYLSPAAEIYGSPQSFLERIQTTCGLWPGEPDNLKQTSGMISEEIWFEQVGRLAAYSKNLILAGMKEKKLGSLFGYFSTLDDIQHRYTLSDKRQIDYSAENGQRPGRYAKIIQKWFRLIDDYLLEIMNAAPPGTSLIIFSDHGMVPIHSVLVLNNYLEKSGFLFSKNEIQAISSGNAAHIYINREQIGAGKYSMYLSRLKNKLASLCDDKTGEPVFELIADSLTQKKLGLYHAEKSGDLFVSCRKGYAISGRFLPAIPHIINNSFDPEMFRNQKNEIKNFLLTGTMNETGRAVHGCLSTVREGQSIFYAWGKNVPVKKLKNIYSLQIAPTVAKLLGINPPALAQGKPVF